MAETLNKSGVSGQALFVKCDISNEADVQVSASNAVCMYDWLFGLEFNSPVNTIKVISSQFVYPTTFFLCRVRPLSDLCAQFFVRNWQLQFLIH